MDNVIRLKKLLSQKGYSITMPRLKVFEALQEAHHPTTVTQLSNTLKDVDRVSIYRTIELFEKIGIVHRVWTGFKSKIELSDAFSSHHHHFTCVKCGKTIGLESDKLETVLKDFGQEYNFELTHHSVELSGYCGSCLNSKI